MKAITLRRDNNLININTIIIITIIIIVIIVRNQLKERR
jgi:hypothetical protein